MRRKFHGCRNISRSTKQNNQPSFLNRKARTDNNPGNSGTNHWVDLRTKKDLSKEKIRAQGVILWALFFLIRKNKQIRDVLKIFFDWIGIRCHV